ncbi:MAG TPA: ABC transporter permease subunit [Chloroflexia bacterium]|nr:ABC transporter permease subunit [Chloroflexia bacterium]
MPLSSGRASMRVIPRPSLLNSRTVAFAIFLAALVWSLAQAGIFSKDLVNGGGWTLVWQFVRASVQPDLSPEILGLAIPSMLTTLAFAVCATALCLVIGIVGGILSSEVWWQSVLPGRSICMRRGKSSPHLLPWLGVRGVLAVPRAIHEIIWGLFFINILGLDPLVAILAIGIPYGAILAKVYADILDETPREPLRALQNSGVPPLKSFFYTLLPQAFPDMLSYGFYRLECAIRSAAVLGLIGAGGLGYQILLSLQSLRYEQVWTFLYLLILLSGLTDGWSSLLHRRLHVTRHGVYQAHKPGSAGRGYSGSSFARYSMLALMLMVPLSFWYVQADFSKLFAPRAARLLAGVVSDVFPPNLDPALLGRLFQLSAQTLSMSILAITIAGLGGLLLSFPAAANFSLPGGMFAGESKGVLRTALGAVVLLISRGMLLVSRALSEGIWALLVLFVLFPGILPGAVALGLYNLGVLGRLMAEVTENMDNRPLRALKGQGAANAQVLFYGVLPQTLSKNLAYVLYRWEVCVRATVVVGLVGAGGLGRLLADQLSSFDYRSVLTSLLFYVGLTFLVDVLSALVRRAVR